MHYARIFVYEMKNAMTSSKENALGLTGHHISVHHVNRSRLRLVIKFVSRFNHDVTIT